MQASCIPPEQSDSTVSVLCPSWSAPFRVSMCRMHVTNSTLSKLIFFAIVVEMLRLSSCLRNLVDRFDGLLIMWVSTHNPKQTARSVFCRWPLHVCRTILLPAATVGRQPHLTVGNSLLGSLRHSLQGIPTRVLLSVFLLFCSTHKKQRPLTAMPCIADRMLSNHDPKQTTTNYCLLLLDFEFM